MIGSRTNRSICLSLLGTVLLLAAVQGPSCSASEPRAQVAFNPYSYIPRGSKIPDPAKDVVFADLDGDGTSEVVIFYLVPDGKFVKPSIMALRKQGKVWQDIWRTAGDGWAFIKPSGVYDMLQTGRPQIVSYISVGASCQGTLDIYQFEPLYGAIMRIDGWPKQSCAHNLKIKDLDGDGIPEIIFTETNYSTIAHIYWWNGEQFVLSDSSFPRYYDPELRRLVQAALMPGSPAPVMWGRMAFQIYMLQRRYREAIDFSLRLLCATSTAKNTRTSSTGTPATENAARDATEAIFHRWMGEAYESLHELTKARKEFEKARELDLAAKRLDPFPSPLQ